MRRRSLAVLLSAALAYPTVSLRAQEMNMDVMAKWSAFTVVRYAVVGEYSGEPSMGPGGHGWLPARATDRLELTFDWNQNETALVGTPVFKNFQGAMTFSPVAGGGPCPTMPVRVSGTYDHVTVTSVTPMANAGTLRLTGTQSHPAATTPHEEGSKCVEGTMPASTNEVTMALVVIPTVFFAMPTAGGEGVSISKDGKSIVTIDKENPGWTWTYTPTGLR